MGKTIYAIMKGATGILLVGAAGVLFIAFQPSVFWALGIVMATWAFLALALRERS